MYINFDYDNDIRLNFKIFISANIKLHEANKSFVQYCITASVASLISLT